MADKKNPPDVDKYETKKMKWYAPKPPAKRGKKKESDEAAEPKPAKRAAKKPAAKKPAAKKAKAAAKPRSRGGTKKEVTLRNALAAAALDSLSPATVLVAPEGDDVDKVVFVSRGIDRIFTITPAELEGKDVQLLWEQLLSRVENPTPIREDLDRISANRYEERTDIVRLVRPFPLVLERSTCPLHGPNREYLGRMWAFRNANREFALKEDLRKKRRTELLFRNLTETLLGADLSEEVMKEVVRHLCAGMDGASTVYFPRAGRVLSKPIQFTVSRKHAIAEEDMEALASYADKRLGAADPDDVEEQRLSQLPPELAGLFEARGVAQQLFVPVLAGETRYGIFLVEETDPDREWTRDDAKAALSCAVVLGQWFSKHEADLKTGEARGQAAAASKARSDFIALLSHELRTPLNPLIGFTQLLEEQCEGQSKELQDMVLRIGAGARRLRDLVEDLLTLTRLDSRLDGWRRYHCDAKGIVEDSCGWVRGLALDKEVEVELEIVDDLGVIEADGASLRRAVNAMLSNAVRFSPDDGKVKVIATGRSDSVVIRIMDQGPGVTEEQKKEIFEPFVQGEPVLTRRFGGAGIGLTLVRKVAEAHDGEAWVEDAPGGGSVFSLRIPRSAEPE